MADQGFHHVAIRAVDFDATLKFYAEGLGCSVRLAAISHTRAVHRG
jgi:catechol 2,3-dioxygenase-like lactoylglutathione lyase family enzyme